MEPFLQITDCLQRFLDMLILGILLFYLLEESSNFAVIRFSPNNDINSEFGLAEILVSEYLRADANNWYVVADPARWDTIEVGFVQGREKPGLFIQNTETAGMVFSHDKISYKVRHEYGGAVTDFRTMYGSIVA